jgi:hypothetical protein
MAFLYRRVSQLASVLLTVNSGQGSPALQDFEGETDGPIHFKGYNTLGIEQ